MEIREYFGVNKRFVIGMVHCLPLPGTPKYDGNLKKIYRQAVQDAQTLERCGVDAIIVENMGDDPFGVQLDMMQRAALTVAAQKVRAAVKIPVGVDAAFCDWEAALSIAYAAGCKFVRIPVFVDTVEFYGGIIKPCARECMQFRKKEGLDHIMVMADIQVKHSNMLLPHVSIESSAVNAAACAGDCANLIFKPHKPHPFLLADLEDLFFNVGSSQMILLPEPLLRTHFMDIDIR